MMNRNKIRISGCLLVLFLFITCCEDFIDCESQDDIKLKMSFYKESENDFIPDTLRDVTVLTIASGPDTIFTGINIISVGLPLNPASDTTVFVFSSPSMQDTLYFFYERMVHLVSPKCGGVVYFELKNLISPYNDTIINKDVDIETDQNIQVFF